MIQTALLPNCCEGSPAAGGAVLPTTPTVQDPQAKTVALAVVLAGHGAFRRQQRSFLPPTRMMQLFAEEPTITVRPQPTCPNCGGGAFDEDGDCTSCWEPGVVKVVRRRRRRRQNPYSVE